MEQPSKLLTIILESVFNTHGSDTPVHTMKPFHEWPTMRPFDQSPTLRPPLGPHWDSKPPDIKTESPSIAVGARESGLAFSLEKLLWVVLSGFGVVVLMAIFMKLGGPIRRVRRQLSNVRPAPNDVLAVTLRHDRVVGNLDTPSLFRWSDDLPPPYSECVCYSTNKHDIDEPPPRFSACFVSFTNPKDAEPQVNMTQRQIDPIENGLRVESLAMNNSETVAPGIKTELVFDNGRMVETLS